jgi:hypothetical protein
MGPECEISGAFLDGARAKGDGCYGFLDGNTLASYVEVFQQAM